MNQASKMFELSEHLTSARKFKFLPQKDVLGSDPSLKQTVLSNKKIILIGGFSTFWGKPFMCWSFLREDPASAAAPGERRRDSNVFFPILGASRWPERFNPGTQEGGITQEKGMQTSCFHLSICKLDVLLFDKNRPKHKCYCLIAHE